MKNEWFEKLQSASDNFVPAARETLASKNEKSAPDVQDRINATLVSFIGKETVFCELDYGPPKSISWESSIFSVAHEKVKENRFDRDTFAHYMDEIRDLPDDFGGHLQTFIAASKKSQEEAAFKADMSARNLSRL